MLVVSDFDGTLISKNSFPLWIKFVLQKSFTSFNLKIFYTLTILILKRKIFKKTSHLEFKSALDSIVYPEVYAIEFMKQLQKYIINETIESIKSFSNHVIVTTAAPSCYAKHIKYLLENSGLEIENVQCSELKNVLYFENFRINKRKYFLNHNLDIDIFYTDHSDDIGLMEMAKKNILIKPSIKSLEKINETNIEYELLRLN